MKKFLSIALACLSLSVLTFNQASANVFFGARIGAEKYEAKKTALNLDEGENEILPAVFVGYHKNFFRLEAEYSFHPERKFKGGDTKITSQSIMGNLYFAPPVRSFLQPYMMGGVGVTYHDSEDMINDEKKSDDNMAFSWQIGVGLELEITKNVYLDVGGRWLDMGEAEVKNHKFDTRGLTYLAGFRFEY